MPRLQQILDALEVIAPARYAFPWDSVGLQVGDPSQLVHRGVLALDRSVAAAKHAGAVGAELLVTHHPLFFDKLSRLDLRTHVGRTIAALMEARVALVTAHTNWDSAPGGINDALAHRLGLQVVGSFGTDSRAGMLKAVVFAPSADVDAILDAASEAGAGVIGDYARCAYLSEGSGTFKPGGSADPQATGDRGDGIHRVPETKVEFVLPADRRSAVERAVRLAHSYEEPALDFYPLEASAGHPAGRLCLIEQPMQHGELAAHVGSVLGPLWSWGSSEKKVKKIALVGGAADGEWIAAQRAGADVLITGEVKQHVALEASESGMGIIAAGHYATEMPGMFALQSRLQEMVPEVEWSIFEPEAGASGRPA